MTERRLVIDPDDRSWVIVAHLSGLAGYLIPLGGIAAPVAIMIAKSERRIIAAAATQALFLNLVAYLGIVVTAVMWITILLIPFAIILGAVLALSAILLPIVGAVRAAEGTYFRYPVVGQDP